MFWFLFISILCFNFANANAQNFIVKKEKTREKNVSKTELKEKVGVQIKNVLNQCAQLNRQLGETQIELSKMQKQLFEKVEELIDNKRPFKKASRHQLNQTLKVVKDVNAKLVVQTNVMKDVKTSIYRDVCLKQE